MSRLYLGAAWVALIDCMETWDEGRAFVYSTHERGSYLLLEDTGSRTSMTWKAALASTECVRTRGYYCSSLRY